MLEMEKLYDEWLTKQATVLTKEQVLAKGKRSSLMSDLDCKITMMKVPSVLRRRC